MFFIVHLVFLCLYAAIADRMKDSTILRDFGPEINKGAMILFASFAILAAFLMGLTLMFVLGRKTYLEKVINVQIIITVALLAVIVSLHARRKVSIELWGQIEGQLQTECSIDLQKGYDSAEVLEGSQNRYLFSRWMDYDMIYQFNDYLMDKDLCPGDKDYLKDYAQDLSPCKARLLKVQGVREDYLKFMMFMEVKFASADSVESGVT
jgi:hypothetical protein